MSNPKTSPAKHSLNTHFYGSKLFVKFFFWFWATLLLTSVLGTIHGYFYHLEPEKHRFLVMSQEIIKENGQTLVDAYEKLGIESAAKFRFPGSCWLFDSNLNDIFKDIPDRFSKRRPIGPESDGHEPFEKFAEIFKEKKLEIKGIAEKILNDKATEIEEIAGEMLVGALVVSETNQRYAFISHIPSKMPRRNGFWIDRLIETLPLFLLVTGILCVAMARYMVAPIIELRTATHNFAKGEFTTRIQQNSVRRFDEIGDLAADFNDMAEKIETMIHTQKRLFGDISHELRSPLARLQVSLELLEKKVPESEKAMLARIEKEIIRMGSLIGEILQFSKLESGNINAQNKNIQLHKLIEQICNDAEFEGRLRNCTVKLSRCDAVEITGIYQLIERAIENILRNALKYSPDNSEITVSLQQLEKQAIITIVDKGPGVPEKDLQKLFEPFYRCEEDRDRKSGGIGLGLAIAQRAIKLHHGSINLKNQQAGGLLVEITLPL